ncbi:hypothetical protein V3C99_018936 [Haemonchus contortus]
MYSEEVAETGSTKRTRGASDEFRQGFQYRTAFNSPRGLLGAWTDTDGLPCSVKRNSKRIKIHQCRQAMLSFSINEFIEFVLTITILWFFEYEFMAHP